MARRKHKHRKNQRPDEINVANPGDIYAWMRVKLYRFWFGQVGTTFVYAWGDHLETAFEAAVEWLDDNDKAGYFVDVGIEELKEAAKDEGVEWLPEWPDYEDPQFEKVVEAAEADLTLIGHTTLKHGQYLESYEWGVDDVTDKEEQFDVAEASFEEDRDLLDFEEMQEGPDKENPESGLRVTVQNGEVTVVEWTDIQSATGESTAEDEAVSRQERSMTLEMLLEPDAKWRQAYSGDTGLSLGEVLLRDDHRKREKAIIAAAISAIAYGPNDESLVSYVGED